MRRGIDRDAQRGDHEGTPHQHCPIPPSNVLQDMEGKLIPGKAKTGSYGYIIPARYHDDVVRRCDDLPSLRPGAVSMGVSTIMAKRRRPQGNALVLAVLRSPAHRLLSSMAIELRYRGRRSGRQYVLPVQYARSDGPLVVAPQRPESSTWWRNFQTPQSVTVRLKGRLLEGTARLVGPDHPAWEEDRRAYESRWGSLRGQVTGPLVEITLEGE